MKFLQKFRKIFNIKFTEYSPYGSKVVPLGATDMTKLIVSFHIFEQA